MSATNTTSPCPPPRKKKKKEKDKPWPLAQGLVCTLSTYKHMLLIKCDICFSLPDMDAEYVKEDPNQSNKDPVQKNELRNKGGQFGG